MKKILLVTALIMGFTSCSPKLVGTWNIDRFEVDNPNGQTYTTRNAGEITIKKNGTGERNVEYNMFQNAFSDRQPFRWTKQGDDIITLSTPGAEKASDFDKTWIMVRNDKKKQLWRSTDGRNTVQTLEMSKK